MDSTRDDVEPLAIPPPCIRNPKINTLLATLVHVQMPYDLLRAALQHDAARPFLTFYDDATGERIELSVTTFDNWVAKTAGLLQDGLSVEPGDQVSLSLPPHWQALTWTAAAWAVGACVTIGRDADAAVAVAGPETLDDVSAPDVVALSLRPLGGRFTEPLPDGVVDFAIEVPSYPDRFVPYAAAGPSDPALVTPAAVSSFDELITAAGTRADELNVKPGGRVFVGTDDLTQAVTHALLVPLVTGGSAVLVRNEDRAGRAARLMSERATSLGL